MEIVYWHWWVLGLLLLVAEMLSPSGFFLLWIGAAAILVGGIAWVVPALGWEVEVVMFGVLSVASFFVWKRLRPAMTATDQPALNRRGQSYVGRTFTLNSPVENGVGKLHVDDSQWRISGADVPAGTQVRVVAADGATLKVERV